MAKQNFRPTRFGGFSEAKAYIRFVEVLKKRRNAAGRAFCDAIKYSQTEAPAFRNNWSGLLLLCVKNIANLFMSGLSFIS
jgi:hypothetical protein